MRKQSEFDGELRKQSEFDGKMRKQSVKLREMRKQSANWVRFFFFSGGGYWFCPPKVDLLGDKVFFKCKLSQVFFFRGGYTGFVPQKLTFWGTRFFLCSNFALLHSNFIRNIFNFFYRQLSIPFDLCFVFSVVFPLFFCQKNFSWTLVWGIYWLSPKKRGK